MENDCGLDHGMESVDSHVDRYLAALHRTDIRLADFDAWRRHGRHDDNGSVRLSIGFRQREKAAEGRHEHGNNGGFLHDFPRLDYGGSQSPLYIRHAKEENLGSFPKFLLQEAPASW